jgi:exodeoxyribonuclease VII small subunit
MKKKEEILRYESAQQELQQIVRDLQSEAVPIDELGEKIARANELIQFCRERLRVTEAEVAKLSGNAG